jgi:1-acyl-sn-glycerol-3-phosphate acyltransferase
MVLRGLDMVSLNRGSPRQAHLAVTQECAERLAKGDVVVIFPEGTQVPHGAPLRLTSGGIRLACETGTPVVPVVHNAGRVWPAKGWPDGVGHIRVVVGPALSPQGHVAKGIEPGSPRLDENSIAAALTASATRAP